MADIANKMESRLRHSCIAVKNVPEGTLWRFGAGSKKAMTRKEILRVSDLKDGGRSIDYRRPDSDSALVSVRNIRPMNKLKKRRVKEIPMGEPKTVDQLTLFTPNYDGIIAIPVEYDARLSKLMSKEHAFSVGFTQSIEQSFGFTQGGEAASFKATQETKLGFESRQDTTDTETEQTAEDRGAGLTPEFPPGYDLKFHLERISQKMKIRLTGVGEVDFGLKLGKHWHGKWQGHAGKGGKTWPRWVGWDSYWEEFIPVVKGEGRRDLCLAEYFWENPAPKWLIKELEKPLDLPFDHTGAEFDGATNITITPDVVRGPKYESQRLVVEDVLVG